jgi:hypothetical protein
MLSAFIFHITQTYSRGKIFIYLFFAMTPLLFFIRPYFLFVDNMAMSSPHLALGFGVASTFVFLCYLYMQLFGIIEGSITLNTLIRFYHSKDHTILQAHFLDDQAFNHIILKKVDLMIEMNLATESAHQNERAIRSTLKGNLMGLVFSTISDFCRWGSRR